MPDMTKYAGARLPVMNFSWYTQEHQKYSLQQDQKEGQTEIFKK
jgi:hypothetical protein